MTVKADTYSRDGCDLTSQRARPVRTPTIDPVAPCNIAGRG
jgi:hypothetical protein